MLKRSITMNVKPFYKEEIYYLIHGWLGSKENETFLTENLIMLTTQDKPHIKVEIKIDYSEEKK